MGILTDIVSGIPLNVIQQQKLADQETRLTQLEAENKELKERLLRYESAGGEKCPQCSQPSLVLKAGQPNQRLGRLGLNDYLFACNHCGFEDTVSADSAGRAWQLVRGS